MAPGANDAADIPGMTQQRVLKLKSKRMRGGILLQNLALCSDKNMPVSGSQGNHIISEAVNDGDEMALGPDQRPSNP